MNTIEGLSKLDELAMLPDNWDSYDSPRLTEAAIKAARAFLLVHWDRKCQAVVPVGGGGVQLEYDDGSEEEFLPDGTRESYP